MGAVNYWIYILRCSNGSYYTGYTTDMMRRYQEHVKGTAKCKYTRSFKPLNIAQCWMVPNDKSIAMKIENFIKKLTKKEKEQLILCPEKLVDLFLCELNDEKQ
jgi:putative endonuclease